MNKLGISILGTLILSFGLALTANASDTSSSQVDVNVKSGEFSIEVPSDVHFSSTDNVTKIQDERQTHKMNLGSILVTDARGTQSGYRLTVNSTPLTVKTPAGGFAKGTSAHEMGASTITMNPPTSIVPVGQTSAAAPVKGTSPSHVLDGGHSNTVVQATTAQGMGQWKIDLSDVIVNIDPNLMFTDKVNYPNGVTPYESTIKWALVTAP